MTKLARFLPFIAPLTVLSADLCMWKSKTAPDVLQGHQGSSASDNYWFTHLSDVDQRTPKRLFIFGIHNDHPEKYLPVEWLRGNGEVQVAFDRLAPGKCGQNDFESASAFGEDSKALIRYGPVKQFKKLNAALYVEKVQPGTQKPPAVGPLLKSRLMADRQGEDDNIERIHLEFETGSEGKEFFYTVTNQGSERAQFRIPALSQFLSKMEATAGNKTSSKWSRDGNNFFADVEKPARHMIRVEGAVGYEETQVPIQVLSRKGKTMAAGELTVYFPLLKLP